jgi:GTPase SAR1 family protein
MVKLIEFSGPANSGKTTLMYSIASKLTLQGLKVSTLEEAIRHLKINFTAPSDWLELSRSELLSNRFNLASNIKNSNIYDDFTILTSILNHTNEEAKEIIDRKEQQTLREQEIQAQAQVFASLATPDQEDTTPPQIDMGGTQENPSGMYGNEIPGIQGAEFTPPSEEEVPEKKIHAPEKTKTKRFIDFADLEADEEEIDINYN